MAMPTFRDLPRALEAPEEGRELWSGVPVEEEPAYAEELFRKASDAAMARENALPKEGYVPARVGPAVEPSLESTLAPLPLGLRSRKSVDFTPDTTKLQGKLAGFLSGDRSLASPIPTASASIRSDAPVASTSTLPSTGPQTPAGKPDSMGAPGLPAPSSEGADGDALSRLGLGQALVRALEGSGSIIAGRDLRSGAADTLGERMKQIEALRAKREEQGLTDARERANNRAQVDYLISRFPDRAEDLQKLYGMTGKPNFSQMLRVEEQVALDKAKKATEEVKPGIALRGVEVKEEDAESKARKREQDIALGWARLNAQSAAAAARAAQVVAESGASRAEQKDVDGQLENIQKIVKAGGYTPMLASLQQADEAITSLGAPPSAAAQVKHALPGGDRFLSPQEKAYYTAVDKLKQMEQLAVSGKVVSESERAEFVRQYGTNWYANPKAAAAYIEMLRGKTANQLNMDLASVRASPAGQRALSAYEQAGGVTPSHPIFKGAGTAKVGADKVRMKEPGPAGRTARIPVTEVEARKAQGWTEVP